MDPTKQILRCGFCNRIMGRFESDDKDEIVATGYICESEDCGNFLWVDDKDVPAYLASA